jgi:hypothetical protein
MLITPVNFATGLDGILYDQFRVMDDEDEGVRRTHHGFKQFFSHTWALLCAFVKMQLLGSSSAKYSGT